MEFARTRWSAISANHLYLPKVEQDFLLHLFLSPGQALILQDFFVNILTERSNLSIQLQKNVIKLTFIDIHEYLPYNLVHN